MLNLLPPAITAIALTGTAMVVAVREGVAWHVVALLVATGTAAANLAYALGDWYRLRRQERLRRMLESRE